jgi:hypothetical protein
MLVFHAILVRFVDPPAPIPFVLSMGVVPPIIDVKRLIADSAMVQIKPGHNPDLGVLRTIVVAKIVVIVPRPAEQVVLDCLDIDDHGRDVLKGRLRIDRRLEIGGGKTQPTACERVVPVPFEEHAAAGAPNVAGGDPNPVRLDRGPVACTPDVLHILPDPAAGHPELIVRRLRAAGAAFHTLWGRGQVTDLFGLLPLLAGPPEAANPLVSVIRLGPIARHPLAIGRRHTPHPTDPDEIVAVLVPAPVAWDPDRILILRLLVRRDLIDRVGRLARNAHARLRIIGHDFGERFMHWASRQGLHTLLVRRFGGRCPLIRIGRSKPLSGQATCDSDGDHAQHRDRHQDDSEVSSTHC